MKVSEEQVSIADVYDFAKQLDPQWQLLEVGIARVLASCK